MTMHAIAFITCESQKHLHADDLLVAGPLRERGIDIVPWVWDGPSPEPGSIVGAVMRSCWDYHLRHAEFERWLRIGMPAAIPVWNSPATLLWNLNKRYLLDLGRRGVNIPASRWYAAGTSIAADCLPVGRGHGWVVKPAVSLNGFDTRRFSPAEASAAQAFVRHILVDRDVLIQEFIPEICATGEVSLIFFAGEFSHAVRKLPAAGEFRVHVEHGGQQTRTDVAGELVRQAGEVLRAVASSLLYARVDGVVVDGALIVIEVELIDPMLYLRMDPAAPERFAAAVERAVRGQS